MPLSIRELEQLYRSRYSDFVRVASAISGSEASGADAVQDAFARAIRSRKSFRGDSALDAWVWRIVVNTARSARVRERRHALTPSGWEGNGSPESDQDSEVLGWIAALPERQRETVFLRYFADLDYRDISTILEIEMGTVSATLSAAHRNLRRAMEATR